MTPIQMTMTSKIIFRLILNKTKSDKMLDFAPSYQQNDPKTMQMQMRVAHCQDLEICHPFWYILIELVLARLSGRKDCAYF